MSLQLIDDPTGCRQANHRSGTGIIFQHVVVNSNQETRNRSTKTGRNRLVLRDTNSLNLADGQLFCFIRLKVLALGVEEPIFECYVAD